jgi:hypothetical protein
VGLFVLVIDYRSFLSTLSTLCALYFFPGAHWLPVLPLLVDDADLASREDADLGRAAHRDLKTVITAGLPALGEDLAPDAAPRRVGAVAKEQAGELLGEIFTGGVALAAGFDQ